MVVSLGFDTGRSIAANNDDDDRCRRHHRCRFCHGRRHFLAPHPRHAGTGHGLEISVNVSVSERPAATKLSLLIVAQL